MSRINLPDGSVWPRPSLESDDNSGVAWKATHSSDRLTRADLLELAALAQAYGAIVVGSTQKRRDYVCREIRKALNEEAGSRE